MEIRDVLFCHACQKSVKFSLDGSLNGRHIIKCPNCGHEHCRIIKDGTVTEERWDSRNGDMVTYYAMSTTSVSTVSATYYYSTSTDTGLTF